MFAGGGRHPTELCSSEGLPVWFAEPLRQIGREHRGEGFCLQARQLGCSEKCCRAERLRSQARQSF